MRALRRAQSIAEYAIVVACVTAALITMQHYMKRGVEGRLRQGSDEISQQPFDYDKMSSDLTTKVDIKGIVRPIILQDRVLGNDANGNPIYSVQYEITQDQNVTRSGREDLGK